MREKLGPTIEGVVADYRHGSSDIDLSSDNVSRALACYERVRQHNLAVAPTDSSHDSQTAAMMECMTRLCSPYDKSALLRRLLQGKPALKHAPPTAMSYPAYAFVEDPGPWPVSIDGIHSLASLFGDVEGVSEIEARRQRLAIEQCGYEIVNANTMAEKIQALLQDDEHFDGNEFVALASQSPVWMVRFGHWPAWELTVGIHERGSGKRAHLLSLPTVPSNRQAVMWDGWGAVELAEVLRDGEVAQQRTRESLAQASDIRQRQEQGLPLNIVQHSILNSLSSLQRDAQCDPRDLDWVRYRRQGWVMRKSAEWSGFADLYLDNATG